MSDHLKLAIVAKVDLSPVRDDSSRDSWKSRADKFCMPTEKKCFSVDREVHMRQSCGDHFLEIKLGRVPRGVNVFVVCAYNFGTSFSDLVNDTGDILLVARNDF